MSFYKFGLVSSLDPRDKSTALLTQFASMSPLIRVSALVCEPIAKEAGKLHDKDWANRSK